MNRHVALLFAFVAPLVGIQVAHAQSSVATDTAPVSEPPSSVAHEATSPTRFEVTLGFVGGYARYADLGFGSPFPQGALASGAGAGVGMSGVRYDLRLVVSSVRMTVGGDFVWGFVDPTGVRTLDDHGTVRTIGDQRMFDGGLRFGLGLEASFDRVRLFADVIGTIHFVEARIRIDDASATQLAIGFSPGLRVGARFAVADSFFAQVAIDGTPFGPSWIGGDLSVGFAIE